MTTVKGAKPKKPKLTYEAKHALEKLATHVMGIQNILTGLSEKDLKGLAFEAIRTSTFEDEDVWRGIGEDAKRREAIRTAHRTGKGEWYAVLEVARAHASLPYLWEQITVAHEKRATRDEAVEIGRLMMIDKAGWLDCDIEIQVNIRSALEWRPEDWE